MSLMKTLKEKIRIYIAGPMRNYKDENSPAFFDAEKHLTQKNIYEVLNPAQMDKEAGYVLSLKEAMQRDLEAVFTADSMYMLRGWERSDGAKVEHALALYLVLYILYQ